jgi:RimJ/RimL family protein N-acetyltransferase
MRAFWRHVAYNFREGGLRQVAAKVVKRLRDRLFSEAVLLVYRVDLAAYEREPRLELEATPLTLHRMRELGYYRAVDFPEDTQRSLNSGKQCIGFFLEGALANVAWIERDRLELIPGWDVARPGAIGISSCWTFEGFRGRGIYPDTLAILLRDARCQGLAEGLIAVDPENVASIKGIERAGFIPYFRATRRIRWGRVAEFREPFRPLLA